MGSITTNGRDKLCLNTTCCIKERSIATSAVVFSKIPPQNGGAVEWTPQERHEIEKLRIFLDLLKLQHPEEDWPEDISDNDLLKLTHLYSASKVKMKLRKLAALRKHSISKDVTDKLDDNKPSLLDKKKPRSAHFLPVVRKDVRRIHEFHRTFINKRFGYPVIFDFSKANARDSRELGQRFWWNAAWTKVQSGCAPLHIIFCNVSDELRDSINHVYMDKFDLEYFVTVTDKHYMDLYPREDLVIMTTAFTKNMRYPTARNYNPRLVYIFGVSQTNDYMKSRATREGIKFAQFPFYLCDSLPFNSSKTRITYNNALGIINDLHLTRSWDRSMLVISKVYCENYKEDETKQKK